MTEFSYRKSGQSAGFPIGELVPFYSTTEGSFFVISTIIVYYCFPHSSVGKESLVMQKTLV